MGKSVNLKLVKPSIKYKKAFLEMLKDHKKSSSALYIKESKMPFEKYIKDLDNQSKGINLKTGYVPATTYWLVKNNVIVGVARLRHKLNDKLLKIGGHIGYDVPPSQRRKGYGTVLLKLTLQKAKEKGIKKILVTCDKNNIASAKIIQENGGILENEVFDRGLDKIKQRYWIKL